MSVIVADIKLELLARIAACTNIAESGYGNDNLKKRMRARTVTLRSVLSWINGQEQLEPSGWTTVTTLRKDTKP